MADRIGQFLNSKAAPILLLAFCIALEGAALFYQYVLHYYPCVLCIHVRIIVAAVAIVLVIQLVGFNLDWLRRITTVVLIVLSVWMVERAWQLLATERGWTLGECNMELGFPNWLALDQWFPAMFKIHEPCGYTPDIIFGITMAEVLLVSWTIICLALLWSLIRDASSSRNN